MPTPIVDRIRRTGTTRADNPRKASFLSISALRKSSLLLVDTPSGIPMIARQAPPFSEKGAADEFQRRNSVERIALYDLF